MGIGVSGAKQQHQITRRDGVGGSSGCLFLSIRSLVKAAAAKTLSVIKRANSARAEGTLGFGDAAAGNSGNEFWRLLAA